MEVEKLEKFFPDDKIREIVSKVLKKTTHKTASMHVDFKLLDKDKVVITERKEQACYAEVPREFLTNKDKARFIFTHLKSALSEKQTIRWLQLCLESGAIGDTLQSAEDIYYHGLIIDTMSPIWSIDKIYISLCNYRYIREATALVLNVTKLVDKANIPFWNAFVFSHGHSLSLGGHTWLSWSNSPYSYGGDAGAQKNNVWFIRFLKDYLSGKIKAKTNHFYTEILNGSLPKWKTAPLMVTKNKLNVAPRERFIMLSKKSVDAVQAKNFKEAKKVFSE